MSIEDIEGAIRANWPEAEVRVEGGEGRYRIGVVAEAFADLSRVRRQQAVYACINEFIRTGEIHAVTIDARPPTA